MLTTELEKKRNGSVHYAMPIITVGIIQYATFLPTLFIFTIPTGKPTFCFMLSVWAPLRWQPTQWRPSPRSAREVGRLLLVQPQVYPRTPRISPSVEALPMVPTGDSPVFLVVGRSDDERWHHLSDARYMIRVPFVVRWCQVRSLLCCHASVKEMLSEVG